MFTGRAIKNILLVLSVTLFFATVLITPSSSLDPMNLPKLLALSVGAFAVFAFIVQKLKNLIGIQEIRPVLIATLSFVLAAIFVIALSDTSKSQQIFGVFGRSTGFLTYFCLVNLFIVSCLIGYFGQEGKVRIGIYASLFFNLFYAALQSLDLDPFTWNNLFSPVFGFLGNPNFLSAFIGMILGVVYFEIWSNRKNLKLVLTLSFTILLSLYILIQTKSQQGLIIAALEFGIFIYVLVSRLRNKIISYLYLSLFALLSILGILGTLQIGPLTKLVYKVSATYRGDYWQAGFQMFKTHLINGVGIDGYGDYYRQYRSSAATLRRGPDLISNAAHNVFLDIASNGGLLLLVPYLILVFFALKSTVTILRKNQEFTGFQIGLAVAWLGYLIQSIISINNIGLAIWGWVFSGLIIGIASKPLPNIQNLNKNKAEDFSGLIMSIGAVVGFAIGYLPFSADTNFLSALKSGNLTKIISATDRFPQSSMRVMNSVEILDSNKLYKEALGQAIKATQINSRDFSAWRYIANSNQSSENQKQQAISIMREIDPKNPNIVK